MNGWRILRGESSLASFLACIEESISEREGKRGKNVESIFMLLHTSYITTQPIFI